MHIILNSDVIHTNRPVATGLPAHIDNFCREAASVGVVLVMPRTALLEDERHQDQLVNEAIAKIDGAVAILAQWGVNLPGIDGKKLVQKGELLAALRATGIRVHVEEPSLEDYREAERRACLHLPPQPPDTKTDEMRDLVIWQVALRLAREHGRAILVSRDKIHAHEGGADEAEAAGLLRARDFDEALDLIGRESPPAILARSVLGTVWGDLRNAGLPLPAEVSLRRVSNPEFVTDDAGRVSSSLRFSVDGPAGLLAGTVTARQVAPDRIQVNVRNVTLNGAQWQSGALTITSVGELPMVATPAGDRLHELKKVLGEGK